MDGKKANQGWFVPLSEKEKQAIVYVQNASAKESNETYEILKERVIKLGFNNDEWERLLHFMEWEIPLIIHIKPDIYIPYFLKDTNYRNQFETGFTSGCKVNTILKKIF